MPRFLADLNFNDHVVAGLRRRRPQIDLVRGRDVGLDGVPDPDVLEWAAANDRILLTHDKRTVPKYATDRVVAGLPMPGVIVATKRLSVARAIDELDLIDGATRHDEWANQIIHLPI
jgi:predicted nuclease of predicted toxin-antitoxin system